MNQIELTDDEKKAIKRLKRALKNFPNSLVIFCGCDFSIRKPDSRGRYGKEREVDTVDRVRCDGGAGDDYSEGENQ